MSTALTNCRRRFAEALARFSLLSNRKRILVGFSGGADSALLLSLLQEVEGIEVAAAHLNHGIRGAEADADEAFCRHFCEERKIPFYVQHANIPLEAKESGMTVEETARNRRYAFFAELSQRYGYDAVATAHHADDNLETVLFHLTRGSALDGLCGIPPVRDNILRPLILCTSKDIRAACEEASIPYVIDSTNADTTYTRNFLRSKVIPPLKQINPSVTDAVSQMSSLLRDDRDYLRDEASLYLLDSGRERLRRLPDAVLSRVLLRELRKNGMTPEAGHIRLVMRSIRSDQPHCRISLPGGTLVCDRDEVYTEKDGAEAVDFFQPLRIGRNRIDGDSELFVFPPHASSAKDINKLKNVYKLSIQAVIDSATIDKTVCIRSRRPGDTYRLGNMTRSVKKMLQATKLPLSVRSRLPFLVKGEDILWIPSFPPSDLCPPPQDGYTVLYLCGKIQNHGKDYQ